MKNIKLLLMAIITILVMTGCPGCNEVVPQGYVGMVKTPSGLTGEILHPGHHACWARDRLLLVEVQEVYKSENLSILCADDLNFKFTIEARFRPKKDSKTINKLLTDKGAAMVRLDPKSGTVYVLKFGQMYTTYVQKPMIEVARGVVTKYETTGIRDARESIKKTIVKRFTEAIKDSPMELTELALTNFDYPDEIENAMKEKKVREIAIDKEKKEQAIKLLKAENRIKLAQKEKVARTAEAQAEVAYIRIVGSGLNAKFLEKKRIEAAEKLYETIGAAENANRVDKVILGTNAQPLVNIK